MQPGERRGVWLAVLAVLCFSSGAVLIIWADPLSPYEKTAGRMVVGSIAVLTISLAQGRTPRFSPPDAPRFLLFGLVTAVHFLTFMGSLSFTSIAHSLTLTYTSPVFVTLFSAVFLKEPVARRQYLGMGAVILGIAILVGFQPQLDSRMLIGDGMAVLSAIAFGMYSVIGRSQRDRYPLLTYAFATYAVAGLWLLPAAWFTFSSTHYGARQLLALLAMGVVPLAVGHTLYNAAVRRTHATYVNLIATQEITGGMVLGLVLLGQLPTLNSVLGAVITLAGIGLVLFSGSTHRREQAVLEG
jgi:drug/metabolite transporter (DMT)-like permease